MMRFALRYCFRRWLTAATLVAPLALVPLAPRTARADAAPDMTSYVVQPGDTCVGIAQHLYGDRRRIDVLHKYNPELGPPPHHLVAGSVLRLPKAPGMAPSEPDARLARVRNDVRVETPDVHPGKVDDPLFRGNRVTTADKSSADVVFLDETLLRLAERTLVVIFGDTRAASKSTSTATLVSGALRAHLAQLAGHVPTTEVATKSAAVRLGPGDSRVHVDGADTTRLAVYRGSSTIAAQKHTVEVDGGFGSKAELGHAPTPPRPLPPAPRWAGVPSLLAFADASGQADLSLAYDASNAASLARYHTQIAKDEAFDDLIDDTEVPSSVDHVEAHGLRATHVFVRVSAVDHDEFEGPFGDVARMTVAKVERTQQGTSLTLRVVPSDLRCSVDGRELGVAGATISTDPYRPHRLRCAGAGTMVAALDLPATGAAPPVTPPPRSTEHAAVVAASPQPPPERHVAIELGAGVAGAGGSQLGRHFEAGAAVPVRLGPGALSLGGTLAGERFESQTVASDRLEGARVAGPTAASHTDYHLAARVAYTLDAGPTLRPYAAVAGGVARQTGTLQTTAASADLGGWLLTVEGAVGVGLDLRAVVPFVEAGYRFGGAVASDPIVVPLTGPAARAGLRVFF